MVGKRIVGILKTWWIDNALVQTTDTISVFYQLLGEWPRLDDLLGNFDTPKNQEIKVQWKIHDSLGHQNKTYERRMWIVYSTTICTIFFLQKFDNNKICSITYSILIYLCFESKNLRIKNKKKLHVNRANNYRVYTGQKRFNFFFTHLYNTFAVIALFRDRIYIDQ